MRRDAASQLGSTDWLWKARLRSLLADLAYMSVISAAATATFVIANVFGAAPDPRYGALWVAWGTAAVSVLHIFPSLPFCAVEATLAPAAGPSRYLIFAVTGALALVWWRLADRLLGESPTVFGIVDFLTWTLSIVACAYRSTARASS